MALRAGPVGLWCEVGAGTVPDWANVLLSSRAAGREPGPVSVSSRGTPQLCGVRLASAGVKQLT